MKFKSLIFGLIVLTFLFSLSNCKKENQLPSCTITYPNNGDEFEQGDTIIISVEANDNDGSIVEINYNIDDIKVFSSSSFPYGYSWNTLDETIGNHIIKVIAIDNDGGSKADERTISIIGNATLVTTDASSITHNSATSGGNITNDGGTPIIERGVCWNNSNNPTLSNEHTLDGSGSSSFTSSLTKLIQNTTYYVRAYATNIVGTAYGNEVSFTTDISGEIITDYDGNTYTTIQIGNQVWMAENLKTTHYSDGIAIQLVDENSAWIPLSNVDKAYRFCNGDTYGALYTWAATMNGESRSNTNPSGVQGVCPDGWHVPSSAEWTELIDYLGGTDIAGGKLKETGTTHWVSPNTGATNVSGFTALPAGWYSYYGACNDIGKFAMFWSSAGDSSGSAWYRALNNGNSHISSGGTDDATGFSVRCVKDE